VTEQGVISALSNKEFSGNDSAIPSQAFIGSVLANEPLRFIHPFHVSNNVFQAVTVKTQFLLPTNLNLKSLFSNAGRGRNCLWSYELQRKNGIRRQSSPEHNAQPSILGISQREFCEKCRRWKYPVGSTRCFTRKCGIPELCGSTLSLCQFRCLLCRFSLRGSS